MKRFLYTMALIIWIAGAGVASDKPLWNDFCPEGLRDAEYKNVQWFWPEGTKASQEIYNYWAQRREEFYDGLAQCNLMSENFRTACYENLRSKQVVDNELYIQKLENRKISSQVWRDTNKISSPIMFNILSR